LQFSSGLFQPILLERKIEFKLNLTIFRSFDNIRNFCSFLQKSQFLWGPSQPLLLQNFINSTYFVIFCRSYNIRNFFNFRKNSSFHWGPLNPSSTEFHKLEVFCNFSNILRYWQFSQKWQFSSGSSQPLLLHFPLTPRNLKFFADFTIFASFAVFAKMAVLVGALSCPSSTEYH